MQTMIKSGFFSAAIICLSLILPISTTAEAAPSADDYPGDTTNGYRFRFEIETSSDWCDFWLEAGGATFGWIVDTYSPGTENCGFDGVVFLNQSLERAEAGDKIRISGHAYVIPPFAEKLRFGIAKGNIGATTARIYSEMNTEPFIIEELAFAGVNSDDPNNKRFFEIPFVRFKERRLPPAAQKIAPEIDMLYAQWVDAQKRLDAGALINLYWPEAQILIGAFPDAGNQAAKLMSGTEEIKIFTDETIASGLLEKIEYPVPVRDFRDLDLPVYVVRWALGDMRWTSCFTYEKRKGAWRVLEQRIVMSW
jgi:hypothetical protein